MTIPPLTTAEQAKLDNWRKPHEDETVGEVFGAFFGWTVTLIVTVLLMLIGFGVPAYGLVRFVKWAWQG